MQADILLYSMKKRHIIVLITVLLLICSGAYLIANRQNVDTSISQSQTKVSSETTQEKPPQTFNKYAESLVEPTSIWFIANKHNALPISYVPGDLTVLNVPLRLAKTEQQMQIRKVTAINLTTLFEDAKKAGLQLEFGSGYRSAQYQKTLYDGYVASMGKAEADRSSARPGHSEHQTGLALDFTRTDKQCYVDACFATVPEGKWLAENAYKYGFILRYPQDKEQVTGYMFEPWHYRYVGKELASEMHASNISTLEEFFNLGSAPDYK